MQIYHPLSFLHAGWRHRTLIRRLAWRKVEARYRGSTLGLVWSLAHPLMMLLIYTFVFSVVFRARWNVPEAEEGHFSLFLFSGLIIYALFAESVNEAPGLMVRNQTFIKQIVFPTEVLAWVSLLASLFNFAVSFLLLLGLHFVLAGPPPISALQLPLILLPLLLGTLGIVWLLASLGVYLRDVDQVVGLFTTALLFLSPIFYPASRIPEAFQPFYGLNPMARILEMSKASLFYSMSPNWAGLLSLTLGAWLVAWFGYAWFMKTKTGFADVL